MNFGLRIRYIVNAVVLFAVSVMFSGCEKEVHDPIPDVSFSFIFDITKISFMPLQSMGNYVIITSSSAVYGSGIPGYNSNGIIVCHTLFDNFEAYDRTCPNCFAETGVSYIVESEPTPYTYAECPHCNTVYSLDLSGMPVSGEGKKYYLKRYNIRIAGNNVTVWNNK